MGKDRKKQPQASSHSGCAQFLRHHVGPCEMVPTRAAYQTLSVQGLYQELLLETASVSMDSLPSSRLPEGKHELNINHLMYKI